MRARLPLLVVIGPTASGKSALALRLAEELNGEILSGDSMQVSRGMDIGTAKPTAAERARVPHHLVDILDIDAPFSAADFTVRAAAAVGPSVVGITNKAVARDFFNNPVESQGVGSGVIFKNDGGKSYIVTNNHVVDGASELIVSLSDGRSLPGKLVGADASRTSPSYRSMTATCRQPTSATPTRRSSASPSSPSATRWALSSRAA